MIIKTWMLNWVGHEAYCEEKITYLFQILKENSHRKRAPGTRVTVGGH
jgi:hypothetical protein